MALADEVIARNSAQRVKNLTNPDAPAASTYDAARLAAACADAQAHFETLTGVAYDGAVPAHVAVACEGVIAYLYLRKNDGSADKLMTAFESGCKRVARVTGRDKVRPGSTSPLTTSDESNGGAPVRPEFDQERFGGVNPDPPVGGDQRDTRWPP